MSEVQSAFEVVGERATRDPHGYFGDIRDSKPIVWDAGSRSWLVTSYQHAVAVLRNPEAFSSDRITPFIERKLAAPTTDPVVRQAFDLLADWLVFKDKPDHLRIRLLVNKAFTPQSVAALQARVEQTCGTLLGALPDSGEINLLRDFSVPLSATIISEMLGIPPEDRDRFEHWQQLIGPVVGAGLQDPRRYERLGQAMDELLTYLSALLRRYREHPERNLITDLIRAREDKQALSEAEIVANCTLFLFGGSETTANLIANATRALLLFPEQMQLLREKKVSAAQAVEEFLRFDGSGKAVTRVVRDDMEFFGHHLEKGQRVFIILASANHDPAVFEDPDVLKLDRSREPRHIAFGFGIHTCMGAALARLETTIAVPKILERWRHIELAGPLEWHATLLARGMKALPLRVRA